jgi:hypothetical protein
MRTRSWSLVVSVGILASAAQAGPDETPARRYGLEPDLKTYPQSTPKESLGSLLKAAKAKRVDYVFAQLADPEWVDRRVKETEGGFAALIEESTPRLVEDPATGKRFAKLLADGEWKIEAAAASVRLKDSDGMTLFFRNANGRWYVENRKK